MAHDHSIELSLLLPVISSVFQSLNPRSQIPTLTELLPSSMAKLGTQLHDGFFIVDNNLMCLCHGV